MSRLAGLAGLAILALLAWVWWPTEAARVRATLEELAEAASVPPGERELARVARYAALARGLAPEVVLDGGAPGRTIAGRDAVLGFATRLSASAGSFTATLEDVEVSVADAGDRATAEATAILSGRVARPLAGFDTTASTARGSEPGDPERDVQEVRFELAKNDGRWMVTRIARLEPIERVPPQVR